MHAPIRQALCVHETKPIGKAISIVKTYGLDALDGRTVLYLYHWVGVQCVAFKQLYGRTVLDGCTGNPPLKVWAGGGWRGNKTRMETRMETQIKTQNTPLKLFSPGHIPEKNFLVY